MAVTIAIRRDDSADWIAANPVLALGEMGIETDTNKAKYGDGFAAWQDLPYFVQPQVGAIVPDGTADGQTLRWEADGGEWEANEFLTISDAGNVGIGTTPQADRRLHVLANYASANIALFEKADDTNSAIQFKQLSTINRPSIGTSGDAAAADDLTLNTGGFERMRIDSTGNVGIGTDNPTNRLVVATTGGTADVSIIAENTGSSELVQQGGSGVARHVLAGAGQTAYVDGLEILQNVGGSAQFLLRANADMLFSTNSAERMRIDASGNLLVGKTTAETLTTAGHELRADGLLWTTNESVCHVMSRTGGGAIAAYYVGATPSGGINVASGGTPVFYAGASDARLKDNIADREGALAEVMALRPVRFDWKDGSGSGEGFVAQEVEQVWPDCVVERPDDEYLTTAGLGVVETRLIKAIQEQQAQIDELKSLIEAK